MNALLSQTKPLTWLKRSFASVLTLTLFTTLLSIGAVAQASESGSTYFPDVSTDAWYGDAVGFAYESGWINGEDGMFNPSGITTRAAAAKTLVLMLDLDIQSYSFGAVDISSHWSQLYFETAVMYGLFDANTYMYPDNALSREEAAALALRANEIATESGYSNVFNDVVSGTWYEDIVLTANESDLLTGQTSTEFGVGESINRAEWVMVLSRSDSDFEGEVNNDDEDDNTNNDDEIGDPGEGDLTIILSDESPGSYEGFTVGTNAEVAVFELTANSGSVEIDSFDLQLTQGDTDAFSAFALYNSDGARISRVDSSFNSENQAHMSMLDGGYIIPSGTSETFHLNVTIKSGASTSSNYKFYVDEDMVTSDADSVDTGEEGVETNIFNVNTNDIIGALNVNDNGKISDPQLGGTEEVIAEFELEEMNGEIGVYLTAITFENEGSADLEDAITDIALLDGSGDEIAQGSISGNYISFQLEEDAFVDQDDREEFQVVAKIIGEFGKTLDLNIDNALDVLGIDESGNSVSVTISDYDVASNSSDITTDTISITFSDADADEMRADRKEVELGSFEIQAGADDLYIDSFNIEFTSYYNGTETDGTEILDILEDIELYSSDYGVIDLSCSEDGSVLTTSTFCENDDELDLTGGDTHDFIIRANTRSASDAIADTDASVYSELSLDISFSDLGQATGSIVIRELADDQLITDVTPSSDKLGEITGSTAGFDANIEALSTSLDAVIGSEKILALELVLDEDQGISDLYLDDLTFGERTASSFDSSLVNYVTLYKVESDDSETLLQNKGGSQIINETISFDNIGEIIEQNASLKLRVYVSLANDENNNLETIQLALTEYSVEDDDSEVTYASQDNGVNSGDANDGVFSGTLTDTYVSGDSDFEMDEVSSKRIITIKEKGTLHVDIDTSGSEDTADIQWLQLGEDDVTLAKVTLQADNEDILVDEFKLDFAFSGEFLPTSGNYVANLESIFSSISITDADYNVIATESSSFDTTNATVTFENADWLVTTTETDFYVIADLQSYGKYGNGELGIESARLNLQITKADGEDSGEALLIDGTATDDLSYESGSEVKSAESNKFGFVATSIETIQFVDQSGDGLVRVESSLSGGPNEVVAILEVYVPETNNNEADNTNIELEIERFIIDFNMDTTTNGMTIDKVSIRELSSDDTVDFFPVVLNAQNSVGQEAMTFDLTTMTNGNTIDPGDTVYYEITADVNLTNESDSEYIDLFIGALESGAVVWKDSKDLSSAHAGIRMGQSTLQADKVNE
jgi:hypothetical protein